MAGLGLAAVGAAADLTVAIEPRWRQDAIAVPSAPLINDASQTLRVGRLALLISEIALLRADGGTTRLDGQYGFIDLASGRREWTVQGVPTGEYVGLGFRIGVPAVVNHSDPAQWPPGHPLHPVLNGLHWSWQGGYVFAAIEGRWRAVGNSPENGDRGFSYHLAAKAPAMHVRFLANFRVEAHTRVELALDLARLLAPHRLAPDDGSESTHSAEGDSLAPQLARGLVRSWFWLGAERVNDEAGLAPAGRPAVSAQLVFPPAIAAAGAESVRHGSPTPLAFVVPPGFPQPALPADNPPTAEGVALGEALFFDPRLSGSGGQSCAACHSPEQAFSDTAALSRGDAAPIGQRNAMPLFNLAWSPAYAWDGGQARIRDQAQAAWVNPIEMNGDPARAVAELSRTPELADRFSAAFGSPAITEERVTLALEQYLLTLVSADSRFDRSLRGELELSVEERRGFELFATEFDPARGRRGADCFHCHGGALFTDFGFRNNGLDAVSADAGRGGISGEKTDHGKFKTPSLRNVALTGPYMHDGRFATLEEVVAHYDRGVRRDESLDPNLAKHPDAGLGLSADDQRALVAFLRALTENGPARAFAGTPPVSSHETHPSPSPR